MSKSEDIHRARKANIKEKLRRAQDQVKTVRSELLELEVEYAKLKGFVPGAIVEHWGHFSKLLDDYKLNVSGQIVVKCMRLNRDKTEDMRVMYWYERVDYMRLSDNKIV